jgi:hypothetical protein
VSPFSIGIDATLQSVTYSGYQVEVSWTDSALDWEGIDTIASFSPFQICQVANHVFNGPAEIVQDGCERPGPQVFYVGQLETIALRCNLAGTFTLHLLTLSEESNFGSTLLDRFAGTIPTQTVDATIVCSDATATPTSTATATATPTNIAGPVRVGGVADVHISGDPRSAAADAGNGGSGKGQALALGFATAAAVSVAVSGWYMRRRKRGHRRG